MVDVEDILSEAKKDNKALDMNNIGLSARLSEAAYVHNEDVKPTSHIDANSTDTFIACNLNVVSEYLFRHYIEFKGQTPNYTSDFVKKFKYEMYMLDLEHGYDLFNLNKLQHIQMYNLVRYLYAHNLNVSEKTENAKTEIQIIVPGLMFDKDDKHNKNIFDFIRDIQEYLKNM